MIAKRVLISSAVLAASLGLSGCLSDGSDGTPGINQTLIQLNVLGTYTPPGNVFDQSAAEIVAHDAVNQRLFVVNAQALTVDVLDMRDPAMPTLLGTIDASAEGGAANSVAVSGSVVAVAIEAPVKQDPGKVVFYDSVGLNKTGEVTVGALPDMVVFTPDGQKVLVANEGEPNADYSVDPEGSVSIIDLSAGVTSASVVTADFSAFEASRADLVAAGLRVFGPGATLSQDMEPEYIAPSADGSKAWVTLQENNAVAELDIASNSLVRILPLGFKDHNQLGNELDASNRDGRINLARWPVKGMYQPDAITSYSFNGKTYYITANEGDARDYATWTEEFRVGDLSLNATAFPDAAILQQDDQLGRLRVTSTLGVSNGCDPSNPATDVEADCEYDALYSYGARSFSIWNEQGQLMWDSGSEFEKITARLVPDFFNSSNDENGFDDRSDDKGPEPESVTVGVINGQTFAFIGLERVGGVMVYNVTNPQSPSFVQYLNNRDFSVSQPDLEAGLAGDLGPEGLAFISADNSPNGSPILVVGNEVSGTTTFYGIDVISIPAVQ